MPIMNGFTSGEKIASHLRGQNLAGIVGRQPVLIIEEDYGNEQPEVELNELIPPMFMFYAGYTPETQEQIENSVFTKGFNQIGRSEVLEILQSVKERKKRLNKAEKAQHIKAKDKSC